MSVAHGIYQIIARHSSTYVYCVPGESYLALLNEFSNPEGPQLISTRHEEGAGLMAEAHAKLTGETGTVLVTRGPGLTHLSIALHTAKQDSTPLVAFVGQVPTSVKEREAFQEVDVVAFTAPISKWSIEIPDASRAADLVEEAYRVAASGRPGPVVVSLPEDIDRQDATGGDGWSWNDVLRNVSSPIPNRSVINLLKGSIRPVIIAGRPAQGNPGVRNAIANLAKKLQAPVYNAWRRFDAFDNKNPLFAGNLPILSPSSVKHIQQADVFVLVDDRLDEFTSLHYTFPNLRQRVLVLGGDNNGFTNASDWEFYLRELTDQLGVVPSRRSVDFTKTAVSKHRNFTDISLLDTSMLEASHPATLVKAFAETLPANAIVTSDAGTFASWIYRETSFTGDMRFLGPTAGGMGYALPAAIGARFANSTAPVFAVAGDGGFAMTMSELQTARHYDLRGIGMLVFDNEIYGTIAAHQDRHFPDQRVGIELGGLDYAEVAASFGWDHIKISSAAEMVSAVEAIAHRNARILLHVPIPKSELNPLGFEWPLRVEPESIDLNLQRGEENTTTQIFSGKGVQ